MTTPRGASALHSGFVRPVVALLVVASFLSYFGGLAEVLIGVAAVFGLLSVPVCKQWDKIGSLALLFSVYWLIFLLVDGAFPTGALGSWLNDDGHTTIGLLPFVLLAAPRPSTEDIAFFRRSTYRLVWAGLALLAFGLTGGSVGGAKIMQGSLFWGLTSSHHVPGYIYGTTFIALFADRNGGVSRRRRLTGIVGSLALVGASGSRTTLIGLGLATVWYFAHEANSSQRLKITVAVPAVLVLLLLAVPQVDGSEALLTATSRSASIALFHEGQAAADSSELPRSESTSAPVFNAQERFALYGFAVSLWERSPLVGIGSTRFDDTQLRYSGTSGLVDIATVGTDRPGYATAHNQYLQSLAENGVVGLALLLSIYVAIYRRLMRSERKDIRIAGGMLVVLAFGAGLTSETLTATSLTFEVGTALMILATRVAATDYQRPNVRLSKSDQAGQVVEALAKPTALPR